MNSAMANCAVKGPLRSPSTRMNIRVTAAISAGLMASALAGPALADCVFAKLGEMKVESRPGRLFVDIEVNGVKKKMMINSGAGTSSLTAAGAASLGVARGLDNSNRIVGPKGENIYVTGQLKNVVVGGAFVIPTLDVNIGAISGSDDDVIGSLGQDILAAADVEFDLAHNRIAFYQPKDCDKVDLIYWSPNFSLAPLRKRDLSRPHFETQIKVNDKSFDAVISTTTSYSIMDKTAAKAAGVTPETPGVSALPVTDPTDSEIWVGTFGQVAIGEEQVKNVRLAFSDLWKDAKVAETGSRLGQRVVAFPSVLLGLDFLQAHRVLLSTSQGRMYLTYSGGGVFRPPNAPAPR